MSEKLTVLVPSAEKRKAAYGDAYIDPTGRVKVWLNSEPTSGCYTILEPIELPASFRATIEAAAIRPPKRAMCGLEGGAA